MKYSFVDIETTGSHSRYDRIIEIGILRVEEDKLVKTYNQLINPQTYLSPFISQMTGINPVELETAPPFENIKEEILEVLDDTVFVAHNVRFDYGFIKNEFKRFGIEYTAKQLCTVKLSRKLFPQYKRHSLDSLIERFNFVTKNRHRAFDDAKVIWDFFQKINLAHPAEIITKAVNEIMKKPSLPLGLSQQTIDTLPENPGVYMFYGDNDIPLYIGKSVNIKDRVLSHFAEDQNSAKELRITQQIKYINTIETVGELGALLKEAELIKKMQPLYNHQLRQTKKIIILRKKSLPNGFLTLEPESITHIDTADLPTLMGIFPSKMKAKEYMRKKTQEYSLCEKMLGLEKSAGSCFAYKLQKCRGACVNKEIALKYNIRFVQAFSQKKIKSWPFKGAIKITEYDPIDQKKEEFIINKWCLISDEQNEAFFDYDIYKILVRYIFNGKNSRKISYLPSVKSSQYLFMNESA